MNLQIFDNSKVKIIAFDIDGTLFSSESIILPTYIDSIKRFIENSGKLVVIPSKEKIMMQVGLPVKQIFSNLLPELTDLERDSISDSVLSLLCEKILNEEGLLYEGVVEIIKELHKRKYLLCIASNGRAAYINAILKAYGIEGYFQKLVVINYSSIQSKGDILKVYLKESGLLGTELLMIGDRKSDLDAALAALTPFAFCEYGHAEPGEMNQYSFSIKKISELLDFL